VELFLISPVKLCFHTDDIRLRLHLFSDAIGQSLDSNDKLIFARVGKIDSHMVFGRIFTVEHFARDKSDFEFDRFVEQLKRIDFLGDSHP